jgi:hypothetical protein
MPHTRPWLWKAEKAYEDNAARTAGLYALTPLTHS